MKSFLALLLAIFGLVTVASAQLANPYTNATSTGTTLNSLATINSSNQAVLATTSNTTVPTYVVVGGAGTSGTAQVATLGQASCTMDTTVSSAAGGYFVVASTTTGGDCHPQSTAPSPGVWVVGFLAAGSTTSGSAALVNINGFFMPSANGHLSVAQLQCSDTSGSGTAQSCTTSPSFTPVKGDVIVYYTTTSNTGALTLNVNSTSAAAVQKWLGTALASGDIPANKPVLMTFDGTNWQAHTIGNAPSGGGSGQPLLNTDIVRGILPVRSGGATGVGEIMTSSLGGGVVGDGSPSATNTTYIAFSTGTAFTSGCATGCNGFSGASLYAAQVSGTVYQIQLEWPTNIVTNTGRYWVGLTNSGGVTSLLATDTPSTISMVGLRYSTIAGDTAPVCVTSNGSTAHVYTTSAITQTSLMKLEFDDNGASGWTIKNNGTAVCSGMTTDIPASGTVLALVVGETPSTANSIATNFYGYMEIGQ